MHKLGHPTYMSMELDFTAILSVFYLLFSPATLGAHQMELNQNWPHAWK